MFGLSQNWDSTFGASWISLEYSKREDDLKASADIFTIDPIKYKISEKIKKSFDPKRIFNPGKMYSGI